MGSYLTFCQVGSFIVSHRRNALRRHSSSHSGSFFFCEMRRTTSSFRPLAIVSLSTSLTKPYLYSRWAICSMVSVAVAIGFERASGARYTLNDVPQPQLLLALGLLKMNPLLTRLVS